MSVICGQRGGLMSTELPSLIFTAGYSVWYQQALETRPVHTARYPRESDGVTDQSEEPDYTFSAAIQTHSSSTERTRRGGRPRSSIHSSTRSLIALRRLDLPSAPTSLRGGARLHHEQSVGRRLRPWTTVARAHRREGGSWEGRSAWREKKSAVCQCYSPVWL